MKKESDQAPNDDLRPEYDFSSLRGGVRGKYSRRYRAGVNLVLLDPDVAKAFPTDIEVNKALRTVLRASKPAKLRPKLATNRMQLTRSGRAKRSGPRS